MTTQWRILPLLWACVAAYAPAQQAPLAPSENLVVLSPAEEARDYRDAQFLDWHPLRREMLIRTRFANTNQLHLVSMPVGAPRQLTSFPEPIARGSFHPTDGGYVVFSEDVGGGEWLQLYRFDPTTGASTLLTDGKSRNELGPWSSKGDRIAYVSTRRSESDPDLRVMNPDDPRTDRLLAHLTGGGWFPLDWSPDDRRILMAKVISANETYLWYFDAATGNRVDLTPNKTDIPIAYGPSRFSKDGKGVYLITNKGSECKRLAYLDLTTNETKILTPNIPWDVDDLALSHDGKWIAFVANEEGIGVLHLLDASTGRELPKPKLPVGLISGLAWRRDSAELGFGMMSALAPCDSYSLDVRTGKLERWTTSERRINTEALPKAELIHWKSFDGRAISGFLYRPPARFTGRRPVLANIQGSPEGQSQPISSQSANYYLNELGIALVFPNVRGSTDYGKSFVGLDNPFLRQDSYKDIDALFDWVTANAGFDPTRFAVIGWIQGGPVGPPERWDWSRWGSYWGDSGGCLVVNSGSSGSSYCEFHLGRQE